MIPASHSIGDTTCSGLIIILSSKPKLLYQRDIQLFAVVNLIFGIHPRIMVQQFCMYNMFKNVFMLALVGSNAKFVKLHVKYCKTTLATLIANGICEMDCARALSSFVDVSVTVCCQAYLRDNSRTP